MFNPWKELLRSKGCEFRKGRGVTNFFFNEETRRISEVICGNDRVKADVVILAVGISTLQNIIKMELSTMYKVRVPQSTELVCNRCLLYQASNGHKGKYS